MRARTSKVVIGAFMLSLITACTSPAEEFVEVCEEVATGIRFDDAECPDDDDDGGRFHRSHYPAGTHVPAVGTKLPSGKITAPRGGVAVRPPATGGFGTTNGTTGT